MARFIGEDTYEGELNDPLSLNLYAYVSNNPLKYVDPSGHVAVDVDVFNINWKLNSLKADWLYWDKIFKTSKDNSSMWINAYNKRNEAAIQANKIRNNNKGLQGLMKASDPVLNTFVLQNDSSRDMKVMVNPSTNIVYYADSSKYNCTGCIYDETTYTKGKADAIMGNLASNLMNLVSRETKTPTGDAIYLITSIIGTAEVTEKGTVTTMIYVTNPKGYIMQSVIVTHGGKPTGWTGWRMYH